MNKKEIFFDLENIESSNNINVKFLTLNNMEKKISNNIKRTKVGGSEYLKLINIKNKDGIDKNNLYLLLLSTNVIYKFNIETLKYDILNDIATISSNISYNKEENKYYIINQSSTFVNGAIGKYNVHLKYISNDVSKNMAFFIENIHHLQEIFDIKQKQEYYFIRINNKIYRYGGFYEVMIKFKLEKENGDIVDKDLSCLFKTTNINCKFLEFKNNIIYFEHDNKIRERIASVSNNKLKLLKVEFYYKLQDNYLILLNDNNKYNINNENFDSLKSINDTNILKKIISAFGSYAQRNSELIRGVLNRRLTNNEDPDDKITSYEIFHGYTGYKTAYLIGYNANQNLNYFTEDKPIFKLDDNKKLIHTPFNFHHYQDAPTANIFHNNKYFIYTRLNTKTGGRQIQYITSEDMINWTKFKILKVKGFDLDLDNMYHPNIFKYENTNYVIGIIKHFNKEIERCSHKIIISRDGENFKQISTLHSIDSLDIYGDFSQAIINSIFEYNNKFNIFIWKWDTNDKDWYKKGAPLLNVCKYTCHRDELFYLTTDYYGSFCTKLIKIIDNKLIFNYKCNENGYIKVKLTDKYDNNIDGFNFLDFDILNNNDYEIKKISWKNNFKINYNYVKIHVEMFNSNIYSISGEFYESKKYFNHIIYKVNDLTRIDGYLEGKSDNYLHINLINKFGISAKDFVDDIQYNDDHTKASLNIILNDDSVKTLDLYDSSNDFVEHRGKKFKRAICILNFKLINIPLDN